MMNPQGDGIEGFGVFNLVSSLNTASDLFPHAGHNRRGLCEERPLQWFLLLCFMYKKANISQRN